jgi:hypothetical protein
MTNKNRAPVVNTPNFATSVGVAGLTQFAFDTSAPDPNGDAVTYAWDIAGCGFTGQPFTMVK